MERIDRLKMEHHIEQGVKYRTIQGHSWMELEDLQKLYERRGYKTWLNFGNICDDTYMLTVELKRIAA